MLFAAFHMQKHNYVASTYVGKPHMPTEYDKIIMLFNALDNSH